MDAGGAQHGRGITCPGACGRTRHGVRPSRAVLSIPKPMPPRRRAISVLSRTVTRKPGAPGSTRSNRENHRAGRAGMFPAEPVVPAACFCLRRRAMGAAGSRPSLRLSGFRGAIDTHSSGVVRREDAASCLSMPWSIRSTQHRGLMVRDTPSRASMVWQASARGAPHHEDRAPKSTRHMGHDPRTHGEGLGSSFGEQCLGFRRALTPHPEEPAFGRASRRMATSTGRAMPSSPIAPAARRSSAPGGDCGPARPWCASRTRRYCRACRRAWPRPAGRCERRANRCSC